MNNILILIIYGIDGGPTSGRRKMSRWREWQLMKMSSTKAALNTSCLPVYCIMLIYPHNIAFYSIDATAESTRLGRLVNHSRFGNLGPKVIEVSALPRIVLIAKTDIKRGEELTYDYGDRSKTSLINHPWLAF